MKIVIIGLGGVGGYYGGKLAKKYADNTEIEICFIARGEHLKTIKERGIHIQAENEDFVAKPKMVTDKPAEIGIADYIIIATKSYDLASSIEQLSPCIDEHTVILPLLNGGDITERIREILPNNQVWSGCTYVVSRKTAPGEIKSFGTYNRLDFGYDQGENERLIAFEKIVKAADIDIVLQKDIRRAIWKKFYFISVTASLTSYFDVNFYTLTTTEESREMMIKLSKEFLAVAAAVGVNLSDMNERDALHRIEKLPRTSTTSMHSDYQAGNTTEVETLTGVIVKLGHQYNVPVPMYEKVYQKLK